MCKVRSIGLFASSVFLAVGLVVCGDNGVDSGGGGNNNNNGGGGGGGKGNDIRNYRTERIGTQTWMAENLDNAIAGSVCYDSLASNCAKYGRLYTWEAANRACPSGWHLPSDAEWDVLMVAVGGVKDGDYYWQGAGTKLKSTSGWNNNGNGTNEYGFSALPGGTGYSGGDFGNAGNYGNWWSATQYDASYARYRYMHYDSENVIRYYNGKTHLFSVRCAQD